MTRFFSHIYVLVPIISRIGNFAIIPVALLTFNDETFISYGMFFVYSYISSVIFELGLRQRLLKEQINGKKEFSLFAIKILMLSSALILLIVLANLVLSLESRTDLLIILYAIVDGVFTNLISNGLFSIISKTQNARRFSSYSLTFALAFFVIRIVPLILKWDLFLILDLIIFFKVFFFILSFFAIFREVSNDNASINRSHRIFSSFSLNSLLTIIIVLFSSADRIVGSHMLNKEQMAFYLLIYQFMNGISTLAEQSVNFKFKCFVSLDAIETFFKPIISKSIFVLWLVSPWIAFWCSRIFNLPYLEILTMIVLQFYMVLLWLIYLAFVNILNESKDHLIRAVKTHIIVLIYVFTQLIFMFNFARFTISNLVSVPFFGFMFMILSFRLEYQNSKSSTQSNSLDKLNWIMLLSSLFLGLLNSRNFGMVQFSSLFLLIMYSSLINLRRRAIIDSNN